MKILIDLQALQTTSRHRGIGRYTLALIQALLPLCLERHDVWIALNRSFPHSIEPVRALFENMLPASRIVTWRAFDSVIEAHFETHRREVGEYLRESFIANFKPDIIYIPSLFEGFVDSAQTSIGIFEDIPTAVTFYDLIPLLCKDYYFERHPRMLGWYERKLDHIKRAHLWLAISESSRQDAIQWLNLPEDWVVNISAAAAPHFQKRMLNIEAREEIYRKYNLTDSFVMCAASIDHHKNIKNLLIAYAALPVELRKKNRLVLVCTPVVETEKILNDQIVEAGLSVEEVIITGYVSDEDLVKLYNLCTVLVLPSLYEGFGLPALEAMSCGAAVIGSNTSSIPEVIGREDALFNPLNTDEITAKLHAVLTQNDFRESLQEHGLLQAKKFSWNLTAQCTLDAFERLYKTDNDKKSFISPHKVSVLPKLAYLSPLPPEKTGIADYSAELLSELTRHYAIDIIINQEIVDTSWVRSNCTVRTVAWFKEHLNEYHGRIIYHIGNSVFHQHMFELLKTCPGIVVLHDFFLSSVFKYLELHGNKPNMWTTALYESHGYAAVLERMKNQDLEAIKMHYPCNFSVLQQAVGVITHSKVAQQLSRQWYGDIDVKWQHIPLLRTVAPPSVNREQIRKTLGFKSDDFIVCSFGFLDVTKLNRELLGAWLDSDLATDLNCYLVFVGANCENEYGEALNQQIQSHPAGARITITGFASEALYQQYLIAADAAVQLRTLSRGETSRAVLDCLAYGLPTIINAHGTMADYPETCVYKLPDVFSQVALKEALTALRTRQALREQLQEKGIQYLREYHHPRRIAEQYSQTIEHFVRVSDKLRQVRLMQKVVSYPIKSIAPLDLAQMIVENHAPVRQKQILIDLSGIMHVDLKTGIERVVRGYLNQLLKNPPKNYRIEPVYLNGVYYYTRAFTLNLLDCHHAKLPDEIVEVYPGDIFLGIDLIARDIQNRTRIFKEWRDKGVSLFFILYDLLPIRHPKYFPDYMNATMTDWLKRMASVCHGVICISRTIAEDLVDWLNTIAFKRETAFNIGWSHLAADIQSTLPTAGSSNEFLNKLEKIKARPSILMVGTVEPRKGHEQSLDAFELLWAKGIDVNWVIVGKFGWNVEALGKRLKNHTENGKHLFWFEKSTDEMLLSLYEACLGILVPSNGEGFGLPLIEAAQHQLPILARDLPVFREVAGEHASYFSGNVPSDLAVALEAWLNALQMQTAVPSKDMPWLTWAKSTDNLLKIILDNQWFTKWKSSACE